jgi:Uma2 family endonuclease
VYARHGVRSYWLVGPEEPTVTAYELAATGECVLAERVLGLDRWVASHPFPVAISPTDLMTGLQPAPT